LHMRWLRLRKTQPDRYWVGLDFQVHPKASAMFAASIKSVVGDGASTLFWTDRWIQGKSIVDLAPDLVVAVPRRLLKRRMVQEALCSGIWANDVRNNLSDRAFFQLICIWVTVQEFQLAPGVPDQHIWTPSS
jgi:hypothetical protein